MTKSSPKSKQNDRPLKSSSKSNQNHASACRCLIFNSKFHHMHQYYLVHHLDSNFCSSTSSPFGTAVVTLDCYSEYQDDRNLQPWQLPLLKVARREMVPRQTLPLPSYSTLARYSGAIDYIGVFTWYRNYSFTHLNPKNKILKADTLWLTSANL
jgi:hypothetical protein